MTRDGLVERNITTGEDTRISQRRQEFDLRKNQSEQSASSHESPEVAQTVDFPVLETSPSGTEQPKIQENTPDLAQNRNHRKKPLSGLQGRLRFDDSHGELSGSEPRQHGTRYQRRFAAGGDSVKMDAASTGSTLSPEGIVPGGNPQVKTQPSKPKKLQLSKEEAPSRNADAPNKKLKKAQYKAERSAVKLEAAKKRLPTRHSIKVERNFDTDTGTPKRRLRFEEEVKTQREHLKGPLPTRPVKAGINATIGYAHKKINQVEQENTGVEAAHKGALTVESTARRAYRFHKIRPYRRMAKLEQKLIKANARHAWQMALADNPRLKSNLFSRMAQKQKIKKQYAKVARDARRVRQRAHKAGSITKSAAGFVRRHPMLVGVTALMLVIVFIFSSLLTSCSNMAGGGFTSVILSSYTSEDEDIIAAEEAYTRLETELQEKIGNIENDYPGYDEYRYSLAQIGHDPFALASLLTAKYFDYTLEEVAVELQAIFGRQYTLTVSEEVEIRYRTETQTDMWTDAEGNTHSSTDTVEVAYDYYILNIMLENRAISGIAAMDLDAEQMELYALYTETKGNKPYLFEGNIYVDRGDPTGGYNIPGEALSDERFAAMIVEAEKYLGYPYVWGGSLPSTSFDCSGFVCWVINQSGVGSVGRTTANGLYNICTIVSASEAKPGDLIFFKGTYNTSGASHIGIYVGNRVMLHCGNPIQYTSINTSYWQGHFLAFGRLP